MTSTNDQHTRTATGTPPAQDSLAAEIAKEEAVVAELRRILFTGTVWFAGAIIASGIPLAGLLATGWRPSDLPVAAEVAWWLGAAIGLVGVAGFGWAGCPVLAWELPVATRQKSITIRGGVALYLLGSVTAMVSILAVPIS